MGLLWLASPSAVAHAFSQPSYYPRAAADGGGGGRWFTGSARDGYACSVCHTGGPTWPIHVAGLPLGGYVPGTEYDVRLRWPEFAERAEQLRAANPLQAAPVAATSGIPQAAGPDMSLVAELTSADGRAAGRIVMNYEGIDSNDRSEEWCEHLTGVPASQLFDTTSPAPDMPVPDCDASRPDQRCLLAVQVCGARTLRFTWTAPPAATGPVWLAAGMVTTERLTAEPTHDGVAEVLRPIFPAGSATSEYVAEVSHGCAVSFDRSPAQRAFTRVGAVVLLMLQLRVRRRKRANHGRGS